MTLMNYGSRANKPLLQMLDEVLAQYGFKSAKQERPARPDHALWRKPLDQTLRATVSITLNPEAPPHTWSVEPVVILDSSFVAKQYSQLRLRKDCFPLHGHQPEPEDMLLLRFFPAHIRWQENVELEFPTLKGSVGTIVDLRDNFSDVCQRFVAPVLAQLTKPLDVAEFQLRSEQEFRSKRSRHDEPQYKISNEYIGTALLFLEARQPERGIALLEQLPNRRSAISASKGEAYTQRLFCQADKLLKYLQGAVSIPRRKTREASDNWPC